MEISEKCLKAIRGQIGCVLPDTHQFQGIAEGVEYMEDKRGIVADRVHVLWGKFSENLGVEWENITPIDAPESKDHKKLPKAKLQDVVKKSYVRALLNDRLVPSYMHPIHAAPLNRQSPGGWSALMRACYFGKWQLAQELLDLGASAFYRSPDGMSPLHVAKLWTTSGRTDETTKTRLRKYLLYNDPEVQDVEDQINRILLDCSSCCCPLILLEKLTTARISDEHV